ncbi:MAG: helix-turn-helix transcriptional regulator [Dehalococcoidia bacterium]
MADEEKNGHSGMRLHGEMLSTSILAMLREWNAHGYQLSKRLAESGLPPFDSGTIYRTLRQLEQDGMISSLWDTSASGPARRMYSLTKTGDTMLSAWIESLQKYQAFLQSAVAGQKDRLDEKEQPE